MKRGLIVPVVFHVDYWNKLGWKDELSSNAMTRRQQEVAKTWAHPAVYTPAVVIDGTEWRAWSSAPLPQEEKLSKIQFKLKMKTEDEKNNVKTAVAVWIENVEKPTPPQATGGYL